MLSWLKPPELDDPELAQRAALTHFVLLFSMALVGVLCIIYVLTPGMLINVVILPPLWLVLGAMLALLRSGRVDATGHLTVTSLTAVFTLSTFFAGGLETSLPPLFSLSIVMAGLMISPRAGAVVTVWSVLCTIAVFVVGSNQSMVYSDHPVQSTRFTTQLLTIITVGVIVTWAVDQLRKALAGERGKQEALESALARLERSTTYSEQLIHTLAEAIIVTDDAEVVLSMNDAAVGLLGAKHLGDPLSRILDAPTPDAGQGRSEGLLASDRADAEAVPVQVSRSRLIDPDGQQHWVYVVSDLRARLEAERQTAAAAHAAEEANRAKSTFLANMSHELRTPLNAVIGYSEILLDDLDEPDARGDAERIRTAGRHLLHLINDVLDMSKVEAGRMDVVWEEVALEALTREVVETVLPTASKNGTSIHVDIQEGLGDLCSDGQKLRQILLNLMSNAVKFTEGGEVAVSVRQEGDVVVVAVRDTGIGISREAQDRLFRPFVQADSSTLRRFGGTGLGLALSQSFANMLGGRIEVDSQVGRGSTFTLTLPTAGAQASSAVA